MNEVQTEKEVTVAKRQGKLKLGKRSWFVKPYFFFVTARNLFFVQELATTRTSLFWLQGGAHTE
jgi:hypothetical protein